MISKISVCNQALGWLGASSISTFEDGTTESYLCKVNWDGIRKSVLESHDWSFASNRYVISTPLAESPVFGYDNKFLIDPEILRVISCSDSDSLEEENNINWQKEGNCIVCNVTKIYIKAIRDEPNLAVWSPLSLQALAARIAVDLAIPISKSKKLQQDMWGLYNSKLQEATNRDSLQGKSRIIKSTRFIRVR